MSELATVSTLVYWSLAIVWALFSCTEGRAHNERCRLMGCDNSGCKRLPPQHTWDQAFGRAVLAWVPWALTTLFIQEAAWAEWLRPVVVVGLLGGFVIGRRVERRWGL